MNTDLVIANYHSDIGDNLNNCYASIGDSRVDMIPNVERAIILRAGHTFFERFEDKNKEKPSQKDG